VALNFFQRRKILKKLNYLEVVPVAKVGHETDEKGLVILLVPKFSNEKFNNFMFKNRTRHFKIHLDELGSSVWMQIDGLRKVGDIVHNLNEAKEGGLPDAEMRVTKFMTILYETRYISFREIEEKKATQ
jgi:hypothetical protein